MEIERPMPSRKEFALLEHQLPHFERVLTMNFEGKGHIDTSTMGCGKTYVTCMVAKILGLSMLIVCPKTVKVVWRKVAAIAGVPIVELITYQSASSKLKKQPKHGYLHKTTHTKGKAKVEHHYFSPTEKYLALLKVGVLLVVDEIQFTRNNTSQYRAIQTLVKTIALSSTPSKFALLSATPFDKPMQAINLMKMVGVIRQEELFIYSRPTGWRELLAYCKTKDSTTTQSILNEKDTAGDYNRYAFRLYTEIVRKELCSAMPLVIDTECDAKNGYYNVCDENKEAFEKALSMLQDAVVHVKDPTEPRVGGDCNYADLTLAMVAIEKAKISIFERVAKRYLEDNKDVKVVIGVHYLAVLFALEERLGDYRPQVLHGGIEEEEEREKIVDTFNDSEECRLLLCITRVGGVGISLHDTVGTHPRVLLLSPDFNLIDTHQATGRVYRVGTKSNTTIRLIYANIGDKERNIHRVLANKSVTLRAILEEYTRNDVLLPIDYEEEYEKVKE